MIMAGVLVVFADVAAAMAPAPSAVPPVTTLEAPAPAAPAPPTETPPPVEVPAPSTAPTQTPIPAPPGGAVRPENAVPSAPISTTPVAASPPAVAAPRYDAPAPEQKPHRRLIVKLAADAYYDQIFAVRSYGAEFFIAFGSTSDFSSWEVAAQGGGGRTEHGLAIEKGRLGWSYEWILDRFRLGLSPGFSHLSIERAALSGNVPQTRAPPMQEYSLSGEGHVSVDLVRIPGKSAFYLGASFRFEAAVWGPALTLGYRADFAPNKDTRR